MPRPSPSGGESGPPQERRPPLRGPLPASASRCQQRPASGPAPPGTNPGLQQPRASLPPARDPRPCQPPAPSAPPPAPEPARPRDPGQPRRHPSRPSPHHLSHPRPLQRATRMAAARSRPFRDSTPWDSTRTRWGALRKRLGRGRVGRPAHEPYFPADGGPAPVLGAAPTLAGPALPPAAALGAIPLPRRGAELDSAPHCSAAAAAGHCRRPGAARSARRSGPLTHWQPY